MSDDVHLGTLVAFGLFPLLMIVAAARDIATMTISNRLCLVLALVFCPAAWLAGLSPGALGLHAAAGLSALVLGFAMFTAGWIGGGDAKFLAATALWMGWPDVMPFLLLVALSGGGLAMILVVARQFPLPSPLLRHEWIVRLHLKETGIPYAAAFAAGALLAFPDTALFSALIKL